jgi:ADP-ribose pyrophosphatase YjhB (NUDIX family)
MANWPPLRVGTCLIAARQTSWQLPVVPAEISPALPGHWCGGHDETSRRLLDALSEKAATGLTGLTVMRLRSLGSQDDAPDRNWRANDSPVPLLGANACCIAASVPGVTGRSVLPPDQYVASLARKRMAATAFFRDDQGRVLLVNPVYKETWDLPGGAVEAEESPHAACRREVAEELGLDRPPGRVLAVDWVPSRPERPEGLIVVYDGGVLSDAEIKEIVLAAAPAWCHAGAGASPFLSHRRDLGRCCVRCRCHGEACDVAAGGAVEAVVDAVGVLRLGRSGAR